VRVDAIRHLTYLSRMGRLSSADYRGILDVLHTAGESDAAAPFPQPVLEALAQLIPCDLISYGDFDPARCHRRPPFSLLPHTHLSPAARSAWAALRHTDPLLPQRTPTQALRISDVLTKRQWHAHPLYRTIGRTNGVEHMLRVWLVAPSGVVGGLDFDRGAGRDFSQRDRLVLQTLAPHLLQHRLRTGSHPRDPGDKTALRTLTRREREILALVAGGLTNRQIAIRLSLAPGTVRKHLDNIYEKLNVPGRAAAVAVTGTRPPDRTNPRLQDEEAAAGRAQGEAAGPSG
jgi:DNA-binding CsgD family transcriptional regulator